MHNKKNIYYKLKEHGLRLTKPRIMIIDILLQSKNLPISADEIFKKIREQKNINCDLASVYRTLSSFEEIGLVHKIDLFEGAAHFELSQGKPHKHFFICESCHKMEKLDACLVGPLENSLKTKGYTELSHRLELTGRCPTCSK